MSKAGGEESLFVYRTKIKGCARASTSKPPIPPSSTSHWCPKRRSPRPVHYPNRTHKLQGSGEMESARADSHATGI